MKGDLFSRSRGGTYLHPIQEILGPHLGALRALPAAQLGGCEKWQSRTRDWCERQSERRRNNLMSSTQVGVPEGVQHSHALKRTSLRGRQQSLIPTTNHIR